MNKKHGKSGTPIYKCWQSMIHRCTKESNPRYYQYGGRGITVCQRWQAFANFYEDMGDRPKDYSIDRIDNDDGYHCGHCEECQTQGWKANCRWATDEEQANNKHNNKKVEINGQTLTLSQASEATGITSNALQKRLADGWSEEEAINTPLNDNRRRRRPRQTYASIMAKSTCVDEELQY